MARRQTYTERYPKRARIQNLALALCLAVFLFPFAPRVAIEIVLESQQSQAAGGE